MKDQRNLTAKKENATEVSVIIPLYNEEPNIPELHVRLVQSLDSLHRTWEAVLVNDGSTDKSAELLDKIAGADSRFIIIHFRRNFGQTAAISAGIRYARGEIIIPMDGDLQNDPQDIGRLLDKISEGFDVVSGWRKKRNDPITKIIPSRFANAMISFVTGVKLHDYGCSLKAYRRDVLKDVFLYGEMHRFVPVYAAMRGARVTEVPVQHFARTRGQSKYGLERIGKVLLDLVVVKFFLSFMTKPIYLFGGLGIFFSTCSFLALAAAIAFKLIPVDNPWGPHWHKDFVATPLPLLAGFLISLGVVMILQGVMAEMIMRTYYESQQKDPYNIVRVLNTDARD
jgi:glycosyltransferase involved in cell wall biosynthesis